MRAPVAWQLLGRRAYDDALALQGTHWQRCRLGGPDVCLAVEHPPTITLGRRATAEELRLTPAELEARGIACGRVDRGGGVTYHGPGQLVIYPVVALAARGFGVAAFVWALEEIMIDVAAAFGVRAGRDPRGHGVWAARGKLGAVGIRVRDGVSTHGLALNVSTELEPYRLIVPCGMPGLALTNLVLEGATGVSVDDAVRVAERVCVRRLQSGGAHALADEPTSAIAFRAACSATEPSASRLGEAGL